MYEMEWKEVNPEQDNWKKQWNLIAYYGSHVVGSIILDDDGKYNSVINGNVEFMVETDLDEAKKEFYERLDDYFSGEIDYYNELRSMLGDMD